MKKKKSRKSIITIMVFGLLFLAACSPRHSYHFHGPSKYRSPQKRVAWLKDKIADRLELDDTQKVRLNEITADLIDSGMNYQQRNRALSECIRERCDRTDYNPNLF